MNSELRLGESEIFLVFCRFFCISSTIFCGADEVRETTAL